MPSRIRLFGVTFDPSPCVKEADESLSREKMVLPPYPLWDRFGKDTFISRHAGTGEGK